MAAVASSSVWRKVAAAVIVCGAVGLAYGNGLIAPFIMDDFTSIPANRSIRSLWPIRDVLLYGHEEGRTIDGRPLLNLSLAINRAITGPAPTGFRTVNILIHLTNALFLMTLCSRLLGAKPVPEKIRDGRSWVAFAASLLWAVHPLGTGAVTYIIQRAESLASLLILATVSLVVAGITATDTSRRPWLPVGVAILAIVAGTAKETAVVIPLICILIDRALFAGDWRGVRRHWPWHVAAFAAWPAVILMLTALGGRGSSAGFGSDASPWLYLLTQSKAIWLYLARIIWPQGLVFDYGDFLSSGLAESGGWLAATATLFAAVVYGYARAPVGFLGPLLFFVLLGPTSSIIPVKTQTIAEHRAYLASAALIVPAVATAYRLAIEAGVSRPVITGLVAAVALALGLSTAVRNREFVNPEILWRKALDAEPRNERAIINLATQLIAKKEPASLAEAERLLARVAETGRYPKVYSVNVSALAKAQGRYPEALAAIDAVLGLTPDEPATLADRGYVLWKLKRLREALATLDQALALDDQIAPAWLNRGNVLLDLGRQEEAEQSFAHSVEIDPRYAKGWDHLGIARQARGDRAAALAAFDRAVSLDTADPETRYNRANLLVTLGRPADALADYDAAIGNDPRFRDAHFNRGVVHLRAGRLGPARTDIEAFLQLGGKPPDSVLQALGVQRGHE
jgi:protein O-mannosyl-transferase